MLISLLFRTSSTAGTFEASKKVRDQYLDRLVNSIWLLRAMGKRNGT
jgi:hypothetical protein